MKNEFDINGLNKMREIIFSIGTCLSNYNEGEIDKSECFDVIYEELEDLVEINEKVLIEERRMSNE